MSETTAPLDGASETTAAPPLPALTSWSDHGVHALDTQGRSGAVAVPRAGGAAPRALFVRATVAAGAISDHTCLALEELRDGAGQPLPWIDAPACATCTTPGPRWHGYVQALWPNATQPQVPAGGVTLRVVQRECVSGLPLARGQLGSAVTAVQVESLQPAPLAGPAAVLRLAWAWPAGTSPELRAAWQPARAAAAALWHGAGLQLLDEVEFSLAAPHPLAPLELGPASYAAVDALAGDADTQLRAALAQRYARPLEDPALELAARSLVVVVPVPCLQWRDPAAAGPLSLLGHATRMPGGPSVAGLASVVLVAPGACGALPAQAQTRLGNALAHEIGHFLGLRHRGSAAAGDLMAPDIAELAGQSGAIDPGEAALARVHPLVGEP